VNNIFNQMIRPCVFLLEQASHSPEGGQRRSFALGFPIMDELTCFQYLSGESSARMVAIHDDKKQNWI
jgi:hypothetical protein